MTTYQQACSSAPLVCREGTACGRRLLTRTFQTLTCIWPHFWRHSLSIVEVFPLLFAKFATEKASRSRGRLCCIYNTLPFSTIKSITCDKIRGKLFQLTGSVEVKVSSASYGERCVICLFFSRLLTMRSVGSFGTFSRLYILTNRSRSRRHAEEPLDRARWRELIAAGKRAAERFRTLGPTYGTSVVV